MRERKFKAKTVLRVGTAFIVLGVIIYQAIQLTRPLPPIRLPNPNGYDDFVKGKELLSTQRVEIKGATTDELRAYVTRNAEALKFIRLGLARECRVPLEYTQRFISNHLTDLATFKALTRLLVAQGKLAEAEGRTNDAARIYMETIRFSHEIARGGLVIDCLVSFACEAIVVEPLSKIVPRLDALTCREMVDALHKIDLKSESVAEAQKRDRLWADRTSPVPRPLRMVQMIIQSRTLNPLKAALLKAEQKAAAIQHRRRVLLVEFAARAYELQTGKPPEKLDDLVPGYLSALPLEPGGKQSLNWTPILSQ